MNHPKWGYVDANGRMNDYGTHQIYGYSGIYYHPQFLNNGCYNGYPILQNQNSYLGSANHYPQSQPQQASHPQFLNNGRYNGYPILQNQNSYLGSANHYPQSQQASHPQFLNNGSYNGHPILQNQNSYLTSDYGNQFGHYDYYSEGNHTQWGNQNWHIMQQPDNASCGSTDKKNEYTADNQNLASEKEHQKERRLVNYLEYLPMLADQCDMNPTDDSVNDCVSLNISSDVNIGERGEHDPNATTGNRSINIDKNTFERRTEQDEGEQNALPIANEQSPAQTTKIQNTEPERLTVTSKHRRGCDKRNMFVRTSDDNETKRLCCPFCDKLDSKLHRHLEQKHNSEPDVKKFMSFPKGSKERRQILDSLRKIGTFNWNRNAELNGQELITSRRPNRKHKKTAVGFTFCPYCKGSYTKTGLRFHVKYKCLHKRIVNVEKVIKGERIITALAASVEARIHVNASDRLEKIFEGFQDDNVVRHIRFDWLVILYGNKLSEKYKKPKDEQMVRNRIRLASRILTAFEEIEPDVTEFVKIYQPERVDSLIQAIRNVAQLDTVRSLFKTPATASDAVTAIKQIGQMLRTEYIKRRNREGQRITEDFVTVFESEAPVMISKIVNETQSRRKREKRVELPALDDIYILCQYIDLEREKCFTELSDNFSFKKWKKLSELTMAYFVVFNRRRVGDVQNFEVGDFTSREVLKDTSDQQSYRNLSDECKDIATQLSRLTVLGKKGQTVQAMLDPNVEKAVKLLVDHRQDAGISSNNEYLFALPSSIGKIKVLNGTVVLKNLASECEAKNPSILNGTLLRKQLATLCSTLDLSDNQVTDVARFMGHSKPVHLNVYRQNIIERQVKISQILEAARGYGTNSIADSGEINSDKVTGCGGRKRKILAPSDNGSKKKCRGKRN